jgi:hypothetical protein
MNRLELGFRPSPRQIIVGEVEKWFAIRHARIANTLITEREHLLPSEKAQLSTYEIELKTLESIIIDELATLDLKINLALKAASEAKYKG